MTTDAQGRSEKDAPAAIPPGDRATSKFAHAVAHELQNPLSSVMLLLSVLRKSDDRSGPSFDDYLEKALGATERMRRLIRDLVDLADVGASSRPFEALDCAELVRDVLSDLDGGGSARVDVALGEAVIARGDPVEVRRVFRALLDNALRYHGGRDPVVRVSCERRDGRWRFCVVDRGVGIPSGAHAEVFEPFVRLHGYDEVPGSGLGLALCKRIVERHGGSIGLASEPGRGTEVWFTLPVASDEVDRPPASR